MTIGTRSRHSGARAKLASPESSRELGVLVWIPDRRFAASGMTGESPEILT
jgi:hypothetical protein